MKKDHLRILSYNIHKGFSMGNRKFVLDGIREAIRKTQADIVFLQEVLGEHQGHKKKYPIWKKDSQFEFLADEVWPHYAYGKNAIYTSGHHGNAILSKYPFSFYENIDISTNRLESRGLLHGKIEIPYHEKPIHLICVHLGLLESERGVQMQRICDRIDSHVKKDDPLVIAGDFNDWREKLSKPLEDRLSVKEAFKSLKRSHARTFPSWLPALRLDRVYFRGLRVKEAKTLRGKPWSELSDHTPLSVHLEF